LLSDNDKKQLGRLIVGGVVFQCLYLSSQLITVADIVTSKGGVSHPKTPALKSLTLRALIKSQKHLIDLYNDFTGDEMGVEDLNVNMPGVDSEQ
jgi:hypothetical protein